MSLHTRARILSVLALAPFAAHAQTPSLNLAAAFADTRTALLAGDADIVCIGDSLTFRPGGMHEALRGIMHTAYGNGGNGYQAFSVWTGGGLNPGWTTGFINADTTPHHGLDGMWIKSATTTTSAFFDAQSPISALHYVRMPGAGGFLVDQPQGATYISAADEKQHVAQHILTHSVSSRTWYYTSGGPVILLGQNNLSGTPGARVHRVANGGWGVENFLQRDWTFDEQLRLLTPDLYIIMLGQNNQTMQRDTFAGLLKRLIVRLRDATPDAEIVLVSSYDSGTFEIEQLALAVEDAATDSGAGFINLEAFGGTYAQHLAAGHIDPDGVHFTQAGGQFVARFISDALHTAGESITPSPSRCDSIDFNNNTVYPEDHDVIDFFAVLSGAECPTCNDIDFNNNTVFPEDQDVIDFFTVLAGGTC
ncbi:MAG TPA: GDSL-type esterase/lipase family protein [Phycisphaerales bacterium]|nr:GDSL-type esterase/lipase family protein [Phycisphaerales bacterium]